MFPFRCLLFLTGFTLQICEFSEAIKIGFIILSQPGQYHSSLFAGKKENILQQVQFLKSSNVTADVYRSYQDFGDVIGHWTVYLLSHKASILQTFDWILFLDERTNLDVNALFQSLSLYDPAQDVFAGCSLTDEAPTIIHHFDSTEEKLSLRYPHFSAGFLFSQSLVKRLARGYEDSHFHIDSQYELAKIIKSQAKTSLVDSLPFCVKKDERGDCATWVDQNIPDCGESVSSKNIFVAVKTCEKFHHTRVDIVKQTWGEDVENIYFFSDSEEDSIPTIRIDVENVDRGHCEKTLSILRYYVDSRAAFDWLVVADDDTLLSFPRLQKLLACHDASDLIALGERYGYGLSNNHGYNYLTGGSGMVFSRPTVEKLVDSCFCPSIDSPDDMILGLCLKDLDIHLIHSPYFHQARPVDYSAKFLGSKHQHISFHKHWMIDPISTYKDWLENDSDTQKVPQSEMERTEL